MFAFCLPFIWITPSISLSLTVQKLEPRISAHVECVLMLLTHQVRSAESRFMPRLIMVGQSFNTKNYDKLMEASLPSEDHLEER